MSYTLTIRPNGVGDVTELTPSAGNNYECVDEVTSDGDSTYVETSANLNEKKDLYNLDNHSGQLGTITNVRVYAKVRTYTGGNGPYMRNIIKIGGTEYAGSQQSLFGITSYTDKYTDWAENPYTTAAWTWSDIDNLQAGVLLRREDSAGTFTRCTQIRVVVTYIIAAPTSCAATDGTNADKVTVTWTKSADCNDYQVYRDGVALSSWLGDVATYDNESADPPDVGSAIATRAAYLDKVSLSIDAEPVAGDSHTYKVKGRNTNDGNNESDFSNEDDGYRDVTPTYQWQKSSSVNDESYSNISGATLSTYDDESAPSNGSRRWYRCLIDGVLYTASDYGRIRIHVRDRPVTLLLKDEDGVLLNYLKHVFEPGYKYRLNELPVLNFAMPSDHPAMNNLVYPNELHLYRDAVLIDIFKFVDLESSR